MVTVKKLCFACCFIMITFLSYGQDGNSVDLNHIYNKWVHSDFDSDDKLLVYRSEAFFETVLDLGNKPKRWRFAEHSDVFINSPYTRGKWTGNRVVRCGNGPRTSPKVYYNPPSRIKGRWELLEENGVTSLLLHYYRAEKGKPFQLVKTIRYLIVHLEEDLMELTMINNRNDS